ncbi:MAG TPA: Stk1 family PASTA domain-containing Ser/Thr kinase [Firmicutes bacterium]|nr:Stk1 family PASTA domain-containing Ser/Thr kinase [Bacillota bacterium]
MIGKKLAGRYELQTKIGQGGMAHVYRGVDLILNRTVSIKVLKEHMTEDPDFVRRFRREAQAAARLCHSNIVNIYDVGRDGDIYYIIMEYVPGKDLKQYIRSKGRLSAGEAVAIACQIAEALVQAHASGIIHRDIKPQNIVFSNGGKVKVTDFGIAFAADGTTVTRGNDVFGSVHYLSPEMARGNLAGVQSDLYSLGIVLYEMVTGRVPFMGESPISVAMKHIQDKIPPPSEIVADIPEPLERIILKAVQKNPSLRYQSASELLDDLTLFKQQGISNADLCDSSDHQDTILIKLPDAENRNQARRNKKPWLVPLLVIIFLSACLLTGFLLLRSYLVVPEVVVPDVVEKNFSEAGAMLDDLDLNYSVKWAPHDYIPSGHVISVEPRPGRTVRKERELELTVSEGPKYIDTPDLYLHTEMEARIVLQELSLKPVIVREHNDMVPENKIFEQVPSAGFPITAGEEVKIYISLGSRPFPIDSLKGKLSEEALKYIDEMGLEAGNVKYLPSDNPDDTVIDQYPEAGTPVKPGQLVDLVISENNSAPE